MKKLLSLIIGLLLISPEAYAGRNFLKITEFIGERVMVTTPKRFMHTAKKTQGFKPPQQDFTFSLKDSHFPKKLQFLDKTYERFALPEEEIASIKAIKVPSPHQLDEHSILTELKKKS